MKLNNTDVIFPRVRIRSTVFIFVTVSITSLYNGGLKNENFVAKIYRCFTVKISKATQCSPNQTKWATSSPWFQWSRPISVKKRSFRRPVSLFKSVFFSPIIIFFFNIHIKGAPMFLKCDPYRVWCSIFYSKLVNCILLRYLFVFWKVWKHAVAGKETLKLGSIFGSLPDFPSLRP
jgi:hypothetical protein